MKRYIHKVSNSKLVAYCVMSNHAHILVYTEDIREISLFMKKVNTTYAIYYNKNEERVGYVFANRYYSQSIKNERHLLTCIQYVHQNPVKAGLANLPIEYKFSSFKDYYKNKLDRKMAKLIFGTENYLIEFNNLRIDNDIEIIDVSEKADNEVKSELKIEDLVNTFCEEFEVNLSQVKK